MRSLAIIICLFIFSLTANAQEITGTWEEISETRFTSYTKLCIVKICDTYIGYTSDRDRVGGHCRADFSGVFNQKKRQLFGEGTVLIENTPGHVLGIYHLYYKVKKGEEYLDGLIYLKPDSLQFAVADDSLSGEDKNAEFIRLKRVSNSIDTTDYMRQMALMPCNAELPVVSASPIDQKIINKIIPDTPVIVSAIDRNIPDKPIVDTPVIVPAIDRNIPDKPIVDTPVIISPAAAILLMPTNRVNDTLSVITTPENQLLIKVLDDAVVDGDTVSIFHNGQVVAERIFVSAVPFIIKIAVTKEDPYHEILLVAHNLGTIPPNTSLVLIDAGDRQYRLHAFADMTKNALIILRYDGK